MQTELKLEDSRKPRGVFKSIQKPLVYIRQYLHDIEWFARRTSKICSPVTHIVSHLPSSLSPKRSVSEADSTNSGSSHARGPGIKQLIGVAVSISSLTSLKHEGKSNSLSLLRSPWLSSLSFLLVLFFSTCPRITFGNPPSYCVMASLSRFLYPFYIRSIMQSAFLFSF